MTPGVRLVKKAGIHFDLHEYKHDPKVASYGDEAAEKLGLDKKQVFKTLVVETTDGRLVVIIIPVAKSLILKKGASACGAKKLPWQIKIKYKKLQATCLVGLAL